MITTRNSLCRYIDISGITDSQLMKALNNVGLEISGWRKINNSGLQLAQVIKVEKVLQSKHLNWVTLLLPDHQTIKVICGASNVVANHWVIYAPVNSVINGGIKLSAKKIMGYESHGMICSLAELGVPISTLSSAEKNDIFTLAINDKSYHLNDFPNDAVSRLGLEDTIFEIELPINRSDCLGIEQIARELAAYFNIPFQNFRSEAKINWHNDAQINNLVKLNDQVANKVLSFFAFKFPISQIHQFDLQDWFKLRFCGYHININQPFAMLQKLIMLETGCPTLIFGDQYIDKKLSLTHNLGYINWNNKSVEGIGFQLKNSDSYILGQEFKFFPSMTSEYGIIVCLATNNYVLRKQQKQINNYGLLINRLIKPVSPKFMHRGVDYLINYFNVEAKFLKEFSCKYIKSDHYAPVEIKKNDLNNLLGLNLTTDDIKLKLRKLNFQIKGHDNLIITPPEFRYDMFGVADIAEELGRSCDFNSIDAKSCYHLIPSLREQQQTPPILNNIDQLGNILINQGFYEIYNYNLVNDAENRLWNFFNYNHDFKIQSPLSRNHQSMTYSLLPNLLKTMQYNNHRQFKNLKFFTVSKVYPSNQIHEMNYHLAFAVQDYVELNSMHNNMEGSMYYIKALVLTIMQSLKINVDSIQLQPLNKFNFLNTYQSAAIVINNEVVGVMIKTHPRFEQKMKMQKFYAAELNLDRLCKYSDTKSDFKIQPLITSNPITQDFTFRINRDFNPSVFKKEIFKVTDFCYKVQMQDIYPNLYAAESNITFRIWFNNPHRQITTEDIKSDIKKIKNLVELS